MQRDFFENERKPKNNFREKKEQAAARIDYAIKMALRTCCYSSERGFAFMRLVTHLRANTTLLKPVETGGQISCATAVFLINRLRNLADQHNHWIRDLEGWHPGSSTVSVRNAFRSLAHHLLARYPVPAFMDSIWDLPHGEEASKQQWWYIRVGCGVSFRSLKLPLRITQTMEHYVRQAPDDLTVFQALRYGETRGLGGSHELARTVAATRLGENFENSDFWRTVVAFLATRAIPIEQVEPIIEFIHAQKFACEVVFTRSRPETQEAPWPAFSMKGRTMKSILRLVSEWRKDLSIKKPRNWFAWDSSGIPGYRFLEEGGSDGPMHWRILELLDSFALLTEGKALRNCVYTYAERCRRRTTTIWSLRLQAGGFEKHMATIEVDPADRLIVQVRAKCNRFPGAHSFGIIQKWAEHSGLRIAPIDSLRRENPPRLTRGTLSGRFRSCANSLQSCDPATRTKVDFGLRAWRCQEQMAKGKPGRNASPTWSGRLACSLKWSAKKFGSSRRTLKKS